MDKSQNGSEKHYPQTYADFMRLAWQEAEREDEEWFLVSMRLAHRVKTGIWYNQIILKHNTETDGLRYDIGRVCFCKRIKEAPKEFQRKDKERSQHNEERGEVEVVIITWNEEDGYQAWWIGRYLKSEFDYYGYDEFVERLNQRVPFPYLPDIDMKGWKCQWL